MKKLARRLLPPRMRSHVRAIFEDSADLFDRLRGRRDELMPPRKLIRNIGGDFAATGATFLRHFVELGGLAPDERVLDVGCGVGRMAVPLTRYLGSVGSYEGFDIDATEIGWCARHITARYPNFHFQVADIYSKRYNPKGRDAASEYRFPYPDVSFDFVFLTSVFTHLLPSALENYTREIARVLKPGGRCCMTFLLLNPDSKTLLAQRRSSIDLDYDRGFYRIGDDKVPEWAVAYEEKFIIDLHTRHGLRLVGPVRHGNWCGRADGYDCQDIVIATKA